MDLGTVISGILSVVICDDLQVDVLETRVSDQEHRGSWSTIALTAHYQEYD